MADAPSSAAEARASTHTPRLAEPPLERWPFWIGVALIALYAGWYASQILQHTALPYFDQTNYVMKVYDIVDRLHAAPSKLVALDPATYLGSEPVARSPLPAAVPAMLWGGHATPQQVALWFLAIRVMSLVGGLYLLARAVGTTRWIPGAVLTILGSLFLLRLNQSHLLLDVPFACVALLAFGTIVRDMQKMTAGSAAGVCGAMLALVLTKPQGVIFLLPLWLAMFVLYGARVNALRATPETRAILTKRTAIFSLFVGALVYLTLSRYGRGVFTQWAIGKLGYWESPLPGDLEWEYFTGVLPPWLVVAVIATLIFRRRSTGGRGSPTHVGLVLGLALPLVAGWLIFNYGLSYARDPRVLWAGMPVFVAAAFIFVSKSGRVLCVACVLAVGLCVSGVLGVCGVDVWGLRWNPGHVLGPTVAEQRPVREIGLIRFVQAVRPTLDADPSPILTLVNDEFVDYQSLNLAARYTNGDAWPRWRFMTFGWSLSDFDIGRSLEHRWFVTKRVRPVTGAAGGAWRPQRTIHALLTDPKSPVRGAFEVVAESPVWQPTFGEWPAYGAAANPVLDDVLVLYRRTRELSAEEIGAAREFGER